MTDEEFAKLSKQLDEEKKAYLAANPDFVLTEIFGTRTVAVCLLMSLDIANGVVLWCMVAMRIRNFTAENSRKIFSCVIKNM